jgi:hypothetical protein
MSVSPNSGNAHAVDKVVRTTQIITGAQIAMLTIFLLIVVGLVHFAGFDPLANAAAAAGQAAAPNAPGAANPAPGAAAQEPSPLDLILTYLSVGVAATLLPVSFILPNIIMTQRHRAAAVPKPTPGGEVLTPSPGPAPNSAAAFQTSAILGGALAEGPAFLAGVAYLIAHNPIALVVFFVALATLIFRFPTRERAERWIAIYEEKLRYGSAG